jgi:hypothetical protein
LALVEKKGAVSVRLTEDAFGALPFEEKQTYLRKTSAKEKLDLLLADPDGKRLTASMEPQEFFWLVKEIGENDAMELLQLASPEQWMFILDLELWEGWEFSQEKACHWLNRIVEGGEARVHELLKYLDFEFLQLFLGRELIVGGGIGDQGNDEERLADYDHTFDGVFMLTFKNPKHSQLIGSFLSMLIKLDNPLYTALMEGVKGDVDIEIEDQCYRFRSGRLEDLGFPPYEEALSIYGRLNPETFELDGGKILEPAVEPNYMLPVVGSEDTLLFRALPLVESASLIQELNYLVNSALVAEGNAMREPDEMADVLQRVFGYLNIALEKLAGSDEQKAAQILVAEPLRRLFQLGYSIVLDLKFAAQKVETKDYASGKLLAGLKSKRPRFYRGLDPDGIDGYREFREMADVTRSAELLSHL